MPRTTLYFIFWPVCCLHLSRLQSSQITYAICIRYCLIFLNPFVICHLFPCRNPWDHSSTSTFPISQVPESGNVLQSFPLYPPQKERSLPCAPCGKLSGSRHWEGQFLVCQRIPQTSPVVFSICGLRPFSNKTLTILSHLLLENFHDSLRLKRESTQSMQTSQALLTIYSIHATFL